MKYTTVDYYHEFKCIGGSCEDSCCDNWEIDLDDGSLKYYMSQKGELGKRIKKCTDVKGKKFILNGDRCPFHNDEDLCDLFIELSEDALCKTCTEFPRHVEEFDDLKEVSLTMSCPEASRIMLAKKEPIRFTSKEGIDSDYGLKDISKERRFPFWKKKHENKLDEKLYNSLYIIREHIYSVLQDRDKDITKRALEVLEFADSIQRYVDEKDYAGLDEIAQRIKENNIEEMQEIISKKSEMNQEGKASQDNINADAENVSKWFKEVLNMYDGLENIKPSWKVILEEGLSSDYSKEDIKAFLSYYKDNEYEFEHILVYYIFNYLLGASYDGDVLTKVKFAAVSFLVILHLDCVRWKKKGEFTYEDQVDIAHAYSKEVEHSYNNYESLCLVLSAHPLLATERIIDALCFG